MPLAPTGSVHLTQLFAMNIESLLLYLLTWLLVALTPGPAVIMSCLKR